MESTWLTREVPVLEAAARLADQAVPGSSYVGHEEVAAEAGLDREVTLRGLLALIGAGYLAGREVRGDDRVMAVRQIELLERGRRSVGGWPREEGGLEVLLEVLDQRIEAETDPDAKSRLTRLREAAQGIGRDVGTSLVTAFLKSVAGLP